MANVKLHWKTEELVKNACEYISKMTVNHSYPFDYMYLEAGVLAEEMVRSRYAHYDEEHERYTDLWEIDIDELFTDDDWKDVEQYIDGEAEVTLDWLIMYESSEVDAI